MQNDSVYRDDSDAIRQELERIRTRHTAEARALSTELAPLYAARSARAAGGTVLLVGAVLLVIATLQAFESRSGWPTLILLASWPAALVISMLIRLVARRCFESLLLTPLAATEDIHMDLARARRFDVREQARVTLASMERWSLSLPLAGVSLLLPLTLHFLFSFVQDLRSEIILGAPFVELVLGEPARAMRILGQFDEWITLSGVIVGHCHLVLAVLAWRHGSWLARNNDTLIDEQRFSAGFRAYIITVATSLLPGVVLMFIPVGLVLVTGLFIPVLFAWASKRLLRERASLHLALARMDSAPAA